MAETIRIAEIEIEVVFKDIRNVHLSVLPPHGSVRVSSPNRFKLETLRLFAISRLGWIREQRRKFAAQERETPRDYVTRESHYLWGRRYLLRIVEREGGARLTIRGREIVLGVRPGSDRSVRDAAMQGWYRGLLRERAAELIRDWERKMGVKVNRLFVQRMKTKWGSCNPGAGTIRLNTELAKKPKRHLEYVVVHELAHLLERGHNERFRALMDRFLPDWRNRKESLNRLPLGEIAKD